MHFSENTRNSCALHGALGTLNAIKGAVPVVHATGGCGVHYSDSYSKEAGLSSTDGVYGRPLSSTNIGEKHVVFGGGSRLREQLKNTVKILDAEIYAIVTGCATELVGDDIAAMAKEGIDQGFPVIFTNTPGFRGTFHNGYEKVIKTLIADLPEAIRKASPPAPHNLVNVWGIIPQQDPFWRAHLQEIGNIIESLGAVPNLFFDFNQSIHSWAQVGNAVLNIAVSPWGHKITAFLEQTFGTPGVFLDHLPVGPLAVRNLVEHIEKKLNLQTEGFYSDFQKSDLYFKTILENLRPVYFADHWQRTAVIVAESSTALGIADFIDSYLGIEIAAIILTDPLDEPARNVTSAWINSRFSEQIPETVFTEDRDRIEKVLVEKKPGIIFGSSIESAISRKLNAPLVRVSFPIFDTVIINRGFAGISGAVTLLEEIGTALRR
jgi:nitrogenase molybdenum-iron protein beta chain